MGAKRAQHLLLRLAAVVMMMLMVATGGYAWDSFHGDEVAGRATFAGHAPHTGEDAYTMESGEHPQERQ